MTTKDSRSDKFSWLAGDIKILHHPDPEILKEAKEIQEKALKERIEKEKHK